MSSMKQNVFDKEVAKLANRGEDIRAVCGRLLETWSYDLDKRTPGIAYLDERGEPVTDLDLACFLSALANRRAVINLPTYKSRRAATRTEGEIVTSKQNRHGRIIGLTSNANVWSFSVMVEDANVMTTDTVGAPRNFMLQDIEGEWHDGWRSIRLIPDARENEIFKKVANAQNSIVFDYLIHPLRWCSFYGRPYLLAKLADIRLKEDVRWYKSRAKELREELNIASTVWPKSEKVGESKPEVVWAFNAEVDGFKIEGTRQPFSGNATAEYEEVKNIQKRLSSFQSQLRFHIRATEYSFWKNAVLRGQKFSNTKQEFEASKKVFSWINGEGGLSDPRTPAWAKDWSWETGFKVTPRKKTKWAVLTRPTSDIKLRFRIWEKTEQVAA
jgi:hypothetical protein